MDAHMLERSNVPNFSTQDLRAHATEYNRDRTHTAKWALGLHDRATGNRDPLPDGLRRPVQPTSQKIHTAMYRDVRSHNNRLQHRGNIARRFYVAEEEASANSSDGSCDVDEETGATKAVHPEAEITYSFDAARSADAGGREVLGQAVEKAVQRWETGVTEKLVAEEYEVVPPEHLERRKVKVVDQAAEEDGFELV